MTSVKEQYLLIEGAIGKARFSRSRVTVTAVDGAEAYAYPKPEGRIAWGVNAAETGVNVLRGIRRPDGSDKRKGEIHELTPEQHRQAAERLRGLAKHSTIPDEKQSLLDKAELFETLAKAAEKRQQTNKPTS